MEQNKLTWPEVETLLKAVEQKYGKKVASFSDVKNFSIEFDQTLKKKGHRESLSESTLKRLWGCVSDQHLPYRSTLDFLSIYLDCNSFSDFCDSLNSQENSSSGFLHTLVLHSKDLLKDEFVEIGWGNNRYLLLSYEGNNQYIVVDSRNSKLLIGDRFEVVCFQKEVPLQLPYILRNGAKSEESFVAGLRSGLTWIKRLGNGK